MDMETIVPITPKPIPEPTINDLSKAMEEGMACCGDECKCKGGG